MDRNNLHDSLMSYPLTLEHFFCLHLCVAW